MVGVAGRSKACKTCKTRKIACTLERPSCRTCIKSSRECGGYERERVFVLDERTRKEVSKPRKPSVVPVSTELPSFTIPPRNNSQKLWTLAPFPPLEASISTKEAYTTLWSISCPSTRAVYRSQILSEFLHIYLPETASSTAGGWLTLLPTHPTFTTALEASILAVATAKLGRTHRDAALIHESRKFYVQGLWELQKALWDEKSMYTDETLAACMSSLMYEIIECPDQSLTGWTNHLKGCAKLFEARGSRAHGKGFARRLFITFRQLEIQLSMTERRTTFLSQPNWLADPFSHTPKSRYDMLLDHMATLSSLIATAYSLFSPTSLQTLATNPAALINSLLSIHAQVSQLEMKLRSFYRRWEKENKGLLYWSTLSTGFNDSIHRTTYTQNSVFPVAFQFPDLGTAETLLLYWATLAILLAGEKSLTLPLPVPIPGLPIPIPQTKGNQDDEIIALARNICQTLEFCFREEFKSTGPMPTVFPLKVAIEVLSTAVLAGEKADLDGVGKGMEFQKVTDELEWAEKAMERICKGVGVELLGSLGGKMRDRNYLPG